MRSHKLARILLDNQDLPIAVHANNHTYLGMADWDDHMHIGKLQSPSYGEHIVIGNFDKNDEKITNLSKTEDKTIENIQRAIVNCGGAFIGKKELENITMKELISLLIPNGMTLKAKQ